MDEGEKNQMEPLPLCRIYSWPMIFALRRLRKKSSLGLLVRWCNGNTAPFGGVIHGSNPCRTANLANKNNGLLDVCTKLAQQPTNPLTGV
jgi:hypothetical protein